LNSSSGISRHPGPPDQAGDNGKNKQQKKNDRKNLPDLNRPFHGF